MPTWTEKPLKRTIAPNVNQQAQGGCMTKRRKFSKEFKQQIVDAVVKGQKLKVSQLKKQHKLSDPLVYSWVKT